MNMNTDMNMNSDRLEALKVMSQAACEMVLTLLAFIIAYYLRVYIPFPNASMDLAPMPVYLPMAFFQMAIIVPIFFLNRLYHQPPKANFFTEFYSVFGAVSLSIMFSIAATAITLKNSSMQINFSRAMIIYAWLLSFLLILAARSLIRFVFRRIRASGIGLDRLAIVGSGTVAAGIMGRLDLSMLRVVGRVRMTAERPAAARLGQGEIALLGTLEELPALIERHRIDQLIIALPDVPQEEMLQIIDSCDKASLKIKIFSDSFLRLSGQLTIDSSAGVPLLSLKDIALRGWRLTIKRLTDIILSLIGIVVLSPLMAVVAIAIRLESRGPALYSQERMGLDAKPFRMLKFRSMRVDAEAAGPGWTRPNDPRRTRLGSVLRRFNIDELPQLFNVLMGQMSLVGPRAERPVFAKEFRKRIPRYMSRHREKAGMTGWAQLNGLRGDTSIEERTRYDLWYIEHWSPLLDFQIIIRQVFKIFSSKNAY